MKYLLIALWVPLASFASCGDKLILSDLIDFVKTSEYRNAGNVALLQMSRTEIPEDKESWMNALFFIVRRSTTRLDSYLILTEYQRLLDQLDPATNKLVACETLRQILWYLVKYAPPDKSPAQDTVSLHGRTKDVTEKRNRDGSATYSYPHRDESILRIQSLNTLSAAWRCGNGVSARAITPNKGWLK